MIKFRKLSFVEWLGLAAAVLVISALSSEAFAGPPKMKPTQQQKQTQVQGQEQGQEQTAIANANAMNANNQNLNISTDVAFAGGDTNFNYTASTAYAPQAWSQMTCSQVIGAAGQGQSQGWSIGLPIPRFLSRAIQDCEKERDASHLAQMGFYGAAIESLCGKRSMQKVHGGTAEACVAKFAGQVAMQEELERLRQANATLLAEREHDLDELRNCRQNYDEASKRWVQHCEANASSKGPAQ